MQEYIQLLFYDANRPLLFNSGLFLFLFSAFIGIYVFTIEWKRWRTVYVTLFSLYFYYKTSGIFFLLLIASTLVDFFLGKAIAQSKEKYEKVYFLVLSMLANLGMLAYFKYTNFFIESLNTLLAKPFGTWEIFLPVGISFYTFQTMSYTIDVYRGKIEPEKDILNFAFFVTFFPQLVAGPIVRAADFLPQIRREVWVSKEDLSKGLMLICAGLFKKAVISDYISINFVDRIFDNPSLYSGFENLLGVYGYALQIYCDFSGYSDMAIGIALLMGFSLPENFRTPYKAASIRDFWRRWHISLSSWLRDYLYISLGGNKKGKIRTYVNLMLTMLLGGLWHGAAWRFVVWGGMHGAALAIDRFVRERFKLPAGIGWQLLGIVFTFHFVCLCWIFFRASSFALAMELIGRIASWSTFAPVLIAQVLGAYPKVFALMLLGYILHFLPQQVDSWTEKRFLESPIFVKSLALAIVMWLVVQTQSAEIQPFIYFQF